MTADEGEIYLSGVQALVRMSLDQIRADRRAKRNTAMFVAGYRGSPLGIVAADRKLTSGDADKNLDG